MEQRRDFRFTAEQRVQVTLLGGEDIRHSGTITNVSGRGMGLMMRSPAAPGAPLRIELEDAMLLGEVMYCRTIDTGYFVGVRMCQVLSGLAALTRMVAAYEAELAPQPPPSVFARHP